MDSVGCVLAIVLFMYSFTVALFEFRNQVLLARKGQSALPCWAKAEIKDAADFPGLVISNCVIGFVIISGLITILFAALFHPLLWTYLYENLNLLLMILIPLGITYLIQKGFERLVYSTDSRVRTRGYTQLHSNCQ